MPALRPRPRLLRDAVGQGLRPVRLPRDLPEQGGVGRADASAAPAAVRPPTWSVSPVEEWLRRSCWASASAGRGHEPATEIASGEELETPAHDAAFEEAAPFQIREIRAGRLARHAVTLRM